MGDSSDERHDDLNGGRQRGLHAELHWTSATQLAAAIARRDVSSSEVLEHLVGRIERFDGPINAVVTWDLDRARAAARAADDAVLAGSSLGPLHGVPMTVKDSYETAGCVTACGFPGLRDHVPEHDAAAVAKVRAAGAIPFAKTNVPLFAGDVQTFNDVFGTTNNPYDTARTPGGSSGGAAAALAMGYTPIEIGSDIGGSIRAPAHLSGVAGLKTSFGIVDGAGHIPGPPGSLTTADIGVFGPMARTVDDLEVMLDVLAGPDRWSADAWTLTLPPANPHRPLRIAAWLDDDHCRVDGASTAAFDRMIDALQGDGVEIDGDARPGPSLSDHHELFTPLLLAALSGGSSSADVERMAADESDSEIGRSRRMTAVRHRDWLSLNERRARVRADWARLFESVDAVLMPVHPRPAILHDHAQPLIERTIEIDGVARGYGDLFAWIAPAGLAYLPAAVVPVGMSPDGLPIGVQIVAPFLHDRTALRVARLVADVVDPLPHPTLAAG
jgi:amidase